MDPEKADESESPLHHIIFRRWRKDHLLCNEMSDECLDALAELLQRQWKDFCVVYRATQRKPSYRDLLVTLTRPYNQEFYPGWIVHWRIGLVDDDPAQATAKLEEYFVQVELIHRRERKRPLKSTSLH